MNPARNALCAAIHQARPYCDRDSVIELGIFLGSGWIVANSECDSDLPKPTTDPSLRSGRHGVGIKRMRAGFGDSVGEAADSSTT